MMGMEVPYTSTGRRQQKARTRDELITATRELMAQGDTPTVEEAAAAAGISRTTAYRYFPNQRDLLLGAHPETLQRSLLPNNPPADPEARLDLAMRAFTLTTLEWEPQLRASLRLSLEPGADQSPLRAGRAIGWIEDALAPLADTHPDVDVRRLAVAIRAATGIESFVWLVDVAGLSRNDAARMMRWSASALLKAALADATAPTGHPNRSTAVAPE